MPTNKQRREAARRHLERQLERRQQEAARRKQRNLIATVVGIVVVLAVIILVVVMATGDSKKKKPTAASSTSASASPSASASNASAKTAGACGYTQGTAASKDVGIPPDPATTPTTNETLAVTTNLGALTFSLDGAAAPCNVQSIAYLATKGYFDNTTCHRLVDSGIFVLQCGDPTATGSGGPGYSVKDENLTAADYSQVGTIAMANSGANTNGSQFFIIYKDSSAGLQKAYTVIGKVTAGMDIVQKVAAAGDDGANSTGDGKPKLPITLTKVTATPAVVGSGTFVTPAPVASTPAASSSAATTPTAVTSAPTKSASPVG